MAESIEWTYEKPPNSFKTLSEQAVWYLRRFASFCCWLGRQSGIVSIPSDETIKLLLDTVGNMFLLGKAMEMLEKHGEGLKQQSMATVAKIVADQSSALTVQDLTGEMEVFTSYVEKNPNLKRLFFSYTAQLTRILDAFNNPHGNTVTSTGGRS